MRRLWSLRTAPKVLEPYRIAKGHPQTFIARMLFEASLMLSRSVDSRLKDIAALRASSLVGCHW